MDIRKKIVAWLEKNVGKKTAEDFSAWATDEKWEAVMSTGKGIAKEHIAKYNEFAKKHEIKSMEDVYAYLRETYGARVAAYVKNGLENGGFKELAKKAKAKVA